MELELLWILGLLVMTLIIWTLWHRLQPTTEDFSDEAVLDMIRRKLIDVYPSIGDELILRPGYSSFTRDKKVIYLCLREPTTGQFYDDKTLFYVALHELAHLISKSYSVETHNQEFMDNFDMLRRRAVGMGYLNHDFSVSSHTYCKVQDVPLD